MFEHLCCTLLCNGVARHGTQRQRWFVNRWRGGVDDPVTRLLKSSWINDWRIRRWCRTRFTIDYDCEKITRRRTRVKLPTIKTAFCRSTSSWKRRQTSDVEKRIVHRRRAADGRREYRLGSIAICLRRGVWASGVDPSWTWSKHTYENGENETMIGSNEVGNNTCKLFVIIFKKEN